MEIFWVNFRGQNVHENSFTWVNSRGQKMSTRIREKCPREFILWKFPLEHPHFEKKFPREFTFHESSPSHSVYEKTDKDWNKIVKSLPMIQAIVWNSYLPFFNWECFCFCMLASTIFGVDLICLSHAATRTRTLTLDTPDRRVSEWGRNIYEGGFHTIYKDSLLSKN